MQQENGGTVLLHEAGIYAVATGTLAGSLCLIGASEQRGGGCSAVTLDGSAVHQQIWTDCGGTMKVCADGAGGLFGIQNFIMGTAATDTKVVWCTKKSGGWESKTVVEMPCIHNLAVVGRANERSLVIATLCASRKDGNDWSHPGAVYAAPILEEGIGAPRLIVDGITKNHGFLHRTDASGCESVYVSGSEGVFALHVPTTASGKWEVEQLLALEVSDLCLCDIDGDGEEEVGVYEGFHGNRFCVYDKTDGTYQRVFSLPVTFGHPVYGGHGRMYAGSRKGEGELYEIWCEEGQYRVRELAKEMYASSLCEVNYEGCAGIVAACKNGDVVFFPFNGEVEQR